jgi:hypothetical protein
MAEHSRSVVGGYQVPIGVGVRNLLH